MTDPQHPIIEGFLAAQTAPPPTPASARDQRRAVESIVQEGFVVAGLQRGAQPALRLLGTSAHLELTAAQLCAIAHRLDRGENRPWAEFLIAESGPGGGGRTLDRDTRRPSLGKLRDP